MKLVFKVALPKETNNLPLLKALSKGGFMKEAPGLKILIDKVSDNLVSETPIHQNFKFCKHRNCNCYGQRKGL